METWHVFKSFFCPTFACSTFVHSVPQIFSGYFWTTSRRYVSFTEWSTNRVCIVCTFFQRAKLHSGRRWFTNWTRNPDHAGIFSDWERGRCKSCGGSIFRTERWKQIERTSNFTDFYFQGARKCPIRKFCNPKDLPRDRNFCVVDWRDDLYLCTKIRYRKGAAHYLLALDAKIHVRYIITLYLLCPRHSRAKQRRYAF